MSLLFPLERKGKFSDNRVNFNWRESAGKEHLFYMDLILRLFLPFSRYSLTILVDRTFYCQIESNA